MTIKLGILGKTFEFDPEVDQILQHGVSVRYYEGSPEDKVVLKEFIFWSARFQTFIVIPRWFIYDGASVPKAFRSIVTKAGPLEYASLPHDFGYTIPAYHPEFKGLDRGQWDLILEDFCKQQGMSWRKRKYTYLAVRAGGSGAYSAGTDEKLFFCPEEHKQWYLDEYRSFNLDPENGDYILV